MSGREELQIGVNKWTPDPCPHGVDRVIAVCNVCRLDQFKPFDFVEPCEPDCTPEQHAYHRGQWDMAGRINEHFGREPHP